jgi:hypothetical protein
VYFKVPNMDAYDGFGDSIAIHSDAVVLDAPGEEGNQTTMTVRRLMI